MTFYYSLLAISLSKIGSYKIGGHQQQTEDKHQLRRLTIQELNDTQLFELCLLHQPDILHCQGETQQHDKCQWTEYIQHHCHGNQHVSCQQDRLIGDLCPFEPQVHRLGTDTGGFVLKHITRVIGVQNGDNKQSRGSDHKQCGPDDLTAHHISHTQRYRQAVTDEDNQVSQRHVLELVVEGGADDPDDTEDQKRGTGMQQQVDTQQDAYQQNNITVIQHRFGFEDSLHDQSYGSRFLLHIHTAHKSVILTDQVSGQMEDDGTQHSHDPEAPLHIGDHTSLVEIKHVGETYQCR